MNERNQEVVVLYRCPVCGEVWHYGAGIPTHGAECAACGVSGIEPCGVRFPTSDADPGRFYRRKK